MDKQTGYIHTVEYSAMRRNEVLTHATTWMKLENMLSERSQTQRTTYFMIPYIKHPVQADLEMESILLVARGLVGRRQIMASAGFPFGVIKMS